MSEILDYHLVLLASTLWELVGSMTTPASIAAHGSIPFLAKICRVSRQALHPIWMLLDPVFIIGFLRRVVVHLVHFAGLHRRVNTLAILPVFGLAVLLNEATARAARSRQTICKPAAGKVKLSADIASPDQLEDTAADATRERSKRAVQPALNYK